MVIGNPKYTSLESDVKYCHENFQREWKAARQNQSYELGDSQDSVIGFRILNEWNNNDNGWFELHHSRIHDSLVKVDIRAETWPGGKWTIEVWTVSKMMYEVNHAKD